MGIEKGNRTYSSANLSRISTIPSLGVTMLRSTGNKGPRWIEHDNGWMIELLFSTWEKTCFASNLYIGLKQAKAKTRFTASLTYFLIFRLYYIDGQIFLQGFRLICIWKSLIFIPNPPRFESFLCVMDFIPTHCLNSQNLIQKSRCQLRSNPFFGHFYVDFRQ